MKKYIISKIGFVKILNKKLHPPTEAYINVHVSCCISCILWLYQYSNASNFARLVTCNYRFSWEHVNSLTIYWQAGFLPCVYIARRFILWIISTTKSTNINIQRINDETRAPRVCDKHMSKIIFLLNQRRFTERDVFSRGHKITIASSYMYLYR